MVDYRVYWIWLANLTGQGSKLAVKLVNIFGNALGVYEADESMLERFSPSFLSKKEFEKAKLILKDKDLTAAEEIIERSNRLGIRVVVPTDSVYPSGLFTLRDAPMVLYVRGKLPDLSDELTLAVVGTRTMTDVGKNNAFAIGYGLASTGATVVSGMALGVDGMALAGAISAGGKTIAVLGGGVDVIYPRDHENLYNLILRNGAVMSEYPPGSSPAKFHFPVRNRIISGMSAATVVVEGDMNSGSLITAKHAIYQGKRIFALPGDVGSKTAEGPNALIKEGALAITDAEDILAEFEFLYPHIVNLKRYRAAMRKLDVAFSADETMKSMRISARGKDNFYGNGTYGGLDVSAKPKKTKAPPVKMSDKRNSKKEVTLGDVKVNISVSEVKNTKKKNSEAAVETLTVNPARIELDLLDETNIKVYNMMKPDVPMIPDELVSAELPINEVLSSLSMLELAGAVESGAGGYFLRRSSDDISIDRE